MTIGSNSTPSTPLVVSSSEFPHLSPRTFEFDSLNHERIINHYYITEQTQNYTKRNRKFFGYTGKTATRWILTLLTGILTALVAKTLMEMIDILSRARTQKLDELQHDAGGTQQLSTFKMFALYSSWNLLLAGTSCLMVLYISPQAAGSGIAEVKAYLNGTYLPKFLSFRAFFVKLIGTVLSVSSGLMVGPEGPLVHLGALIGSALTRGVKNFRFSLFGKQYTKTIMLPLLLPFRNDSDRRDFISIGVAAGFAAAFGAPIGGVLFSLEEASTYWSGKLMWRALTAATLACLVLNALTGKDLSYFGLISLKTHTEDNVANYNSIAELPAYGALGVMGGLLGALYNATYQALASHRPRSNRAKFVEILVISMLTSTTLYFSAVYIGTCSDTRDDWLEGSDFSLRFNCDEGKYNELASLIFGVKEDVIKEIIYDPSRFSPMTLLTCFLIFFPLQLIAFGTAVPAGIFMPSILVGCSFGGFFGTFLKDHWYTKINPGSYALMGAVALLGGIQRTTISLCVIMMEGTGETEYLLPIIFTTVVANYIGNYFNSGVYEMSLHLKHIPFLEHQIHHEFHVFQAKDVMNKEVEAIPIRASVQSVINLLSTSTHAGFPVVLEGQAGVEGSRKLVGFILRDQLYTLLENIELGSVKSNSQHFLHNIQVPSLHSPHRMEHMLESQISESGKSLMIDLESAMNIGPHMVTPECPLSRAYLLFCSMGLRHLVVVDSHHTVVGVITRKDLLAAEHILKSRKLTFEQKKTMILGLHQSADD
eukprot:c12470_g1_i2.p1 GENE.c12470_g1_i2~~c12470_g1_i2.p1  ORF type:complete len:765 (+),score=173.30 c12470_g1_i2:86-2380(+)